MKARLKATHTTLSNDFHHHHLLTCRNSDHRGLSRVQECCRGDGQ